MDKPSFIFAVVLSAIAFLIPVLGFLEEKGVKRYPESLWLDQKLDHFSFSNNETFSMRYISNEGFCRSGAPIFIHVGGNFAINKDLIDSNTHIYDMAKEHHGCLYAVEHRFYGRSIPVNKFTDDTLEFFNADQAIADFVHFIVTIKEELRSSKVILVGNHYGGTLATWIKRKYPTLVTGIWVSSAPLLASTNFSEILEPLRMLSETFRDGECFKRVKNALAEMKFGFENKSGVSIKSTLNLCDSFDVYNENDVSTLFVQMSQMLFQSISNGTSNCDYILNGTDDMSSVTKFFLKEFSSPDCYDMSYKNFLETYRFLYRERPFFYQNCNEFGWFFTQSNVYFGVKIPFEFFITLCSDVFGAKFTKEFMQQKIEETNNKFGGLNPGVTNAYFTYAEFDVWAPVGLMDNNQSTILEGASTCKDMTSIHLISNPVVKASNEKIASLVREWLAT